jgi:hypothetical protein
MLALIKSEYPNGYEDSLITFQTATGELATGLPIETEDTYYLIRMPKSIVPEDEDDFDNTESETDGFENLDNLQIADDVADEDE